MRRRPRCSSQALSADQNHSFADTPHSYPGHTASHPRGAKHLPRTLAPGHSAPDRPQSDASNRHRDPHPLPPSNNRPRTAGGSGLPGKTHLRARRPLPRGPAPAGHCPQAHPHRYPYFPSGLGGTRPQHPRYRPRRHPHQRCSQRHPRRYLETQGHPAGRHQSDPQPHPRHHPGPRYHPARLHPCPATPGRPRGKGLRSPQSGRRHRPYLHCSQCHQSPCPRTRCCLGEGHRCYPLHHRHRCPGTRSG